MAANRPLPSPLPADLPEDWQDNQIVAPQGADVGLTEQHGYNYLMQQVNDAQRAANQLNEDVADKQDKLTGTQGQVVGFNEAGDAVPQEPGVGRSMAGKTVEPTQGTHVTAGQNSEVFNDYTTRTFENGLPVWGNIASGEQAHAEGRATTASGANSHAEGYGTVASGGSSHAEGGASSSRAGSSATAYAAHAEGVSTLASGSYSHAEGYETTAGGSYSHAEGRSTTASGEGSHAEGSGTLASGSQSHAEGYGTKALGPDAHAEGSGTTANGSNSHAAGTNTIANDYQFVVGTYNIERAGGVDTGDRFIVGGGWGSSARKNAFRVNTSGACYGAGAWNTSGADYAELFEWQDRNPDSEDRAGLFVTLDGEYICVANPEDDFILGVVSATPSVVGDVYDDQWAGMYLRDVFGRTVMAEQDFPAETVERPGADGELETVEIRPAFRELAPVVNPDYDTTVPYQPRTKRPEWDAVGMMGKLVAVDDGTCQVNGWATVGQGGRATASAERTKYRVMARLDETHIRLLIL